MTVAVALAGIGEGLVELALDDRGLSLGYGGDVANICAMAARLGAPSRLAARVGGDAFGTRLVDFWRECGVDVAGVHRDEAAATGLYLNEQTEDGEHRFAYWRSGSAGSRLAPDDLGEALFERLGMVVASGVTLAISDTAAAAAKQAAERARAQGARVAFVLNHRPRLAPDAEAIAAFAAASDIVIGSCEDARAVFGSERPETVLARLGAGPQELVLTDGSRPAVVVTRRGAAAQPVPAAEVRNAAGAGDAFAGAYLAARLRGERPAVGLAWGVAASSISVGAAGCAASYPDAAATAERVGQLGGFVGSPSAPAAR